MPRQINIFRIPASEEWLDDNGMHLMGVHPVNDECREFGCALHNPTDHEYRDYPLVWDFIGCIFVRIIDADAGEYVSDPDELAYRERNGV